MNAVRLVAWRYPHWWAAALSAGAWCLLAERWWRSNHEHVHASGFAVIDWSIMVCAMMTPLVFAHLRFTAARSLWRRRQRAMVLFLCGYGATWLLVGVTISATVLALGVPDPGGLPWLTATAFGAAALWQLLPLKRRALAACHGTVPLAPRGWRADRDCVRYGWAIGTRCVVACGALMLACVLAGHSLVAMLGATAIAGAERYDVRANERATSVVLVLLAVVFAARSM